MTRISAVIGISVFMVIVMGVLTYSITTMLLNNMKKKYEPDYKIEMAREIVSDITRMGNTVQAYIITHDTSYLETYRVNMEEIAEKIIVLRENSQEIEGWKEYTDSIWLLFQEKTEVSDELIQLKGNDRISIIIDKIDHRIKEANKKYDLTPTEKHKENDDIDSGDVEVVAKKKRSIFSIFKSKPKTEPKEESKVIEHKEDEEVGHAEMDNTKKDSLAIVEIKKKTTQIKREEIARTRQLSAQELELHKTGNDIMTNLNLILLNLEYINQAEIEKNAVSASGYAQKTVYLISIFCILSSILLIVLGYMVARHIRQNNQYKKALRVARNEAIKLAKAKEVFLSNMSHEIRTPLNAIAGFTEQLLETPLEQEQLNQVKIIRNSTEHLIVVVNDILDYAKIESGKLQFEKTDFMPIEVISEVEILLRQQAEKKGLSFTCKVDESTPQVVNGDSMRLKQILFNLAGNAIKFTPAGKVEIVVRMFKRQDETVFVRFQIIDTGIGILPENIDKIFEEFMQADHSIARKYGGTGLGLPIVKKLVEQQNGTIEVESQLGKGSTFTVTLPFAISHAQYIVPKDESKKVDMPLKGLSILAADDEEYNRLLIQTIFNKHDVKLTLTTNGNELLQSMRDNHYDIILMDVRMPEMSGLDATKLIRKMDDKKKTTIPIIALTAAASEEDVKKCKRAGMNDYVSKPFKEAVLIDKIKQLLSKNKTTDMEKKSKEKPEVSNHNGNGKVLTNKKKVNKQEPDISELISLSEGNNEFVMNMLNLFINNAQKTLSELKEANETGNKSMVAHLAHRLSSPANHIGFKQLGKILKSTELEIKANAEINTDKKVEEIVAETESAIEKTKEVIKTL
jgi:signal transduction histidine kinase/CheY-like chemotaxis protein/HPt (histidine-containing phosphotransfer) domain-containing protein